MGDHEYLAILESKVRDYEAALKEIAPDAHTYIEGWDCSSIAWSVLKNHGAVEPCTCPACSK